MSASGHDPPCALHILGNLTVVGDGAAAAAGGGGDDGLCGGLGGEGGSVSSVSSELDSPAWIGDVRFGIEGVAQLIVGLVGLVGQYHDRLHTVHS